MEDGTLMQVEVEEFIDERPMPLAVPLSKYWAMDYGYFMSSLNSLLSMSASDAMSMASEGRARMEQEASDFSSGKKKPYQLKDGVAYIDLVGPMTKRPNCMAEMFGGGAGASTMRTRQALRAAIADPDAKKIMLMIESPGGEVNGAFDLAGDIAKANRIKPVTAYIEDMGASAAYLVASQAGKIYANSNAITGSIGVYQELHDTSKAASFKGIKVHVIKAGEHKAIGHPGTEITEEQLAVVQANTNKLHGLFLRAVNRGRGLDAKALARVADGGIYIGADGKRAGLIDDIASLSDVHQEMTQSKPKRAKGKLVMATETEVQQMLESTEEGDNLPGLEIDNGDELPEAAVVVAPVAQQAAPFIASTELSAALAAAGVTTPAQLEQLRHMAGIGNDYKVALADQVTKLAIVAFGPVDGPMMAAGVATAGVAELKVFNKQFQGIANAKGLVGVRGERLGRDTASQDIAGEVGTTGGVSSESNEGKIKVLAAEQVTNSRQELNSTGLYSL